MDVEGNNKTEFAGCMLRRQGYKINTNFIVNKFLEGKIFRIVMQTNKNIFCEIGNILNINTFDPTKSVEQNP